MGGVRGEAKAQGRETQVFVIHGTSPSDWSWSLYKSAERERGESGDLIGLVKI